MEIASNSPARSTIEIRSSPPMTHPLFSDIPRHIASEIQLPIGGSALDLALMPVVPQRLCNMSCCKAVLLESLAPAREDSEILDMLNRLPCPSKSLLDSIMRDKTVEGKFIQSFKVSHSGRSTILPLWVLTFWHSVATHWADIVGWKRAHHCLINEFECAEVLGLFSTIPWDARCPIPGATVSDLATFATTEWLTDNHINLLGWYVNGEIESKSVRLVQAGYPERIGYLFNAWNTKTAPPDLKYHWLDSLRQQLRDGTLKKIGFVINTVAGAGLPIPPQVGNHWVAAVIDGENREMWLGDSMGKPPHKTVIQMLDWWLRPAFHTRFSVRHLPCHRQQTSWNCGDRSINMIAHHFDPEQFPLIGNRESDEIQNRLELFYYIVERIRLAVRKSPKFLRVM